MLASALPLFALTVGRGATTVCNAQFIVQLIRVCPGWVFGSYADMRKCQQRLCVKTFITYDTGMCTVCRLDDNTANLIWAI